MHEPQEVNSALTATGRTTATPEQVWAVIVDGWTYSQWVVGNGRMRAVDADWPAPGGNVHHTIGVWPLIINDEWVVEACTPRRELVVTGPGAAVRQSSNNRAPQAVSHRLPHRDVRGAHRRPTQPRAAAPGLGCCPGIGNAHGAWPPMPSAGHNRNEH